MLSKLRHSVLLFTATLAMAGHVLHAQIPVINKGAVICIKPGATVVTKTAFLLNDTGTLKNEGYLAVEGNLVNNDSVLSVGAGIYELKGDWINNAIFEPGLSRVNLSGGNQLIGGSEASTFYDLDLIGKGVKRQVMVDASVINSLNLRDSELATDSNKMFVLNSNVTSIIRDSGFVSSIGNGRLSREMHTGSEYLFPTGSALGTPRYRPLSMTVDSHAVFEVRLANNDPTMDALDKGATETGICEVNPNYYHLIDHISGSDSASLLFFFDKAVEINNWLIVSNWINNHWESIAMATPGTDPPFHTLSVDWSDFTSNAFALAIPRSAVNNTAVIRNVFCKDGNNGKITSIPLDAAPLDYAWSTTSGDSLRTIIKSTSGDILSGLVANQYILVITDTNGCDFVDTIHVTQPATAICASVDVTNVSCHNSTDGIISLIISGGVRPYAYSWSTPNEKDSLIVGISPGEPYNVTVTDADSCQFVLSSLSVAAPERLEVTINKKDITCFTYNDGLALAVIDTIIKRDTIIYCEINSFHVLDSNTFVCGTDTILAIRKGNPFLCEYDTVIAGLPDTIINEFGETMIIYVDIKVISSGNPPFAYQWLDENGAAISIANNISDLTPGLYSVKVRDKKGCADSMTTVIIEPELLTASTTADQTIKDGHSATLEVTSAQGGVTPYAYLWSTGEETRSIKVSPEGTEFFIATLIDSNGCTTSDTTWVIVHIKYFEFPNAFVPEGDLPENRIFMPVTSVGVHVTDLKIFNRWGNLIFETKVHGTGWDGTYKGQKQPTETYIYQALIELPDGTQTLESGEVILIR